MTMRTCFVTGQEFDDEKTGYKWMQDGSWYYFYDIGARSRFVGNPQKFMDEAAAKSSS